MGEVLELAYRVENQHVLFVLLGILLVDFFVELDRQAGAVINSSKLAGVSSMISLTAT